MSSSAPNILLDLLAFLLAPLFYAATYGDHTEAQAMAHHTIASLDPDSTPDLLQAAQVVGFSIAAVNALGQSAVPDLPEKQAHRLRAQADRLGRSAARCRQSRISPRPAARPAPRPQPQPYPAPLTESESEVLAQSHAGWASAMQDIANEPDADPTYVAALRAVARTLMQPPQQEALPHQAPPRQAPPHQAPPRQANPHEAPPHQAQRRQAL